MLLRYILFHHQTTTAVSVYALFFRCVISSFITKPQLARAGCFVALGCVISSFITKPQQLLFIGLLTGCCVISSFITKPQLAGEDLTSTFVALYPLSSPNHNPRQAGFRQPPLRYILFHHQTTTCASAYILQTRCVISSFITKPQRG